MSYSKNTLYTGIMQFWLLLQDYVTPPSPNKNAPPSNNIPPFTQIKICDCPLSPGKDFSEIFNPPSSPMLEGAMKGGGGGVNALLSLSIHPIVEFVLYLSVAWRSEKWEYFLSIYAYIRTWEFGVPYIPVFRGRR